MLTDHSTKQSHDTRARILQAAFTVLSRQGYENTSVKDIAEEAGVAQGLVHYHYKSKQQLVLAVLEFVCKKVELGLEGEAGALAAFAHAKDMLKDKESRRANGLYVQLIGVGLSDPVIGEGVRTFVRRERAHVEDIARGVLGQRSLDQSPARGLAIVVWAAMFGITVQSLIDVDFDTDEAVDDLASMALSTVFPAATGA